MELTERERMALKELVDAARRDRPEDALLAALAAKLVAGGGPVFAKYGEVLEAGVESDPAILDRVRRAIAAEERLWIRYTARSTGETTERTVRPFNIHFYDGNEYLEAFCELRGADRVFAVGSIETVLEPRADGE